MKKNMNSLAEAIVLKEGGKKSVSIAQAKEFLRLTAIALAQDIEYNILFTKYGERLAKKEEKKNAKR